MPNRFLLLTSLMCALVAASTARAQPREQPAKPAALAVVPTDSFAFVTVNVGKLWVKPDFKPLRDWFAAQKVGPTDDVFGVPAGDIDRLTLFMPSATKLASPMALVTTKKPYNEAKLIKALGTDRPEERGGRPAGNVIELAGGGRSFMILVDDRTLLLVRDGYGEGQALAGLLGQVLAKKTDGPLAAALADATRHDVAVGLDVRAIAPVIEGFEPRRAAPYLALLKARTVTFAADFDKTARGALKLTFADAADAKRAAPVLKEGIADVVALFEKDLARKEAPDAVERAFLSAAIPVLKAAKVEAVGTDVFATGDLPYADAVATFTAALPKSYSATTNSLKGLNHLKQLALGVHNYESTFGTFPSDVSPGGANGLAWSWRVQLLPFIEQDALYKQLDFTKAWDAPENLKKLEAAEMPKTFEIPGRPAPKGHTYFRIFSRPKNAKGTDQPWLVEGQRGGTFGGVSDGLSNTLMIVEAGEAVPWYKPDVLAYDGKLPLPQLGDKDADRFIAAMGDGSVRVLRPSKVGEKTLRALITPRGGEVFTLP